MKVLKIVALVLVGVVALLAGIGMLLPRHVSVERTRTIAAPPCTAFALIEDWNQFNKWSPWAKLDPATQYTFSDPAAGVGAWMSWSSADPNVGKGKQTFKTVEPCAKAEIDLEFDGFPPNVATYTLQRVDGGTSVTWGFSADMGAGPVGRWIGLMIERGVGDDYAEGLANLAAVAEALPKADFEGLAVERRPVPPVRWVVAEAVSAKDAESVGLALETAYLEVKERLSAAGITSSGAPLAIYIPDGANWQIKAGLPLAADGVLPKGAVVVETLPGGPALTATHKGPYESLGETTAKFQAYVAARGFRMEGPMLEEYVTDPATTAPDQVVTLLRWRLAGG